MTRTPFGALIAVALASAFVATWPFRGDWAQSVAVTTTVRPLAYVTSWRIVPGAINIAALSADRSDVLVVGEDGVSGQPLTAADIASLRARASSSSRAVLSYLDIAEVDPSSSIWDQAWSLSRPSWSDGDSCLVPGGMRVKFWDASWKAMVFSQPGSYLDRVIALGYDGVYVGGLQSLSHSQMAASTLQNEAARFITELAAQTRGKNPGFIVMSEFNSALLAGNEFRKSIDGLGVDGLLYGADGRRRRPMNEIRDVYEALRPVRDEGKPIFAVEHVSSAATIDQATIELRRRGIIPGFEPARLGDPQHRGDECQR